MTTELASIKSPPPTHPVGFLAWLKKHRFWLILGTVFTVVTGITVVIALSSTSSTSPLASGNAAPDGAKAAATILGKNGVNVEPTSTLIGTLSSLSNKPAGSTTVFLYDSRALLTTPQLAQLKQGLETAQAKIVLLRPAPLALRALDPSLGSAGTVATPSSALAAKCSNADAKAAGSLSFSGAGGLSSSTGEATLSLYRGPVSCFPSNGKTDSAAIMASNSSGSVVALGASALIRNDGLASAGNAALTLRLLGSTENVIWYLPSLQDVPAESQGPSLAQLLPRWLAPAAAWLMVVAVVGMFWRGRRLGPLVDEALPVIVKVSETVTGRARMYQDAKAIDAVVRSLRRASMNRLAHALRLGTRGDPHTLAEAVAIRTGKPLTEITQLLIDRTPRNEKEMLTLAGELAALEEEAAKL